MVADVFVFVIACLDVVAIMVRDACLCCSSIVFEGDSSRTQCQ